MALNKKIKDELHALKGLDSSSVYDEEDQKKKKAFFRRLFFFYKNLSIILRAGGRAGCKQHRSAGRVLGI